MKKLTSVRVILFIIICLLISVGCSAKTSVQGKDTVWNTNLAPVASGNSGRVIPPTTIVLTQPAMSNAGSTYNTNSSAEQSNSLDIQRMIVRISNITLMVSDIPTAMDKISQMAANMQGFVVSSNQWKDNGALLGTITIRVPSAQFDSAMSTLRGMADEVTSENTSAQDVTQQYTDLNAQLTNLQATEAQLLDIMKKAVTVDDILAVQSQLTNTEGQIESIKGQIQYLQQTSATSLISVSLTQSKLTVQLTASNGRNVRSGDNVYFTATVTGGFTPYNYKWDFGDKSTSTDESPVHVYNSSGKFTVTLTVTDDKGNTATDIRTDYITVQSGWNVGNIARTAWSGLRSFGRVLVNILVWLGIFSPVWIIGGGIVIWIWHRRKMKAKVS